MPTNWKQLKAIEQYNRRQILTLCPDMQDRSGIYMFYRADENNNIFARYIGKSETSVLERCASHLQGYKQYIDKSIRAHKLYSEENPTGWQVCVLEYCLPRECDEKERYVITMCERLGMPLHNVESGGTSGKTDINERKPARGYRDGVKQGERNVIKKIAHWFDLYLDANIQVGKADHARAQKALADFYQLLQGESE